MSRNSRSFSQFFLSGSFSFQGEKRTFSQLKAFISAKISKRKKSCLKRTSKKNRYFGTSKSATYVPNICALTYYRSAAHQVIWCDLVFSLNGKAVVLPIRITFKRIDSALVKLTLSCLKNVIVWNTYAIKRAY